jgi:hypothetical protein
VFETAHLTVNRSYFDTLHLHGIDSLQYLSTVFYHDTILTLQHQSVFDCDSIWDIHIFITCTPPQQPDTIDYDTKIHVYWYGVLAVPNPKNLDELRLATYYWYKDDELIIPQSNKSWIEVGPPIPAGKYGVYIHYESQEILYLERIFEQPFGISAYPNPLRVSEELTIDSKEKIRKIEIFDGNGILQKLPIRHTSAVAERSQSAPYHISGFTKQGVYVVRIYLEDQTIETIKIIVK